MSGLHASRRVATYVGLLAVALLLAVVRPDWELALWSQAVAFAVIILGLNLIVGHSGQFSLCQTVFAGLGAYTSVILVTDHGWPFIYTLPVSLLLGFVIGTIVGLPALRIKGHYLTMFTLALVVSFGPIIKRFPDFTGGPNGKIMLVMWNPPGWMPFGLSSAGWLFMVLVAIAALTFLAVQNLVHSRLGDALLAVRTSDLMANSIGADPSRFRLLAFAVGGTIGALGGSLLALATGVISAESFGILPSLLVATGLILGGVGRVAGSAIGGLVAVFLPYWTSGLTSGPGANLIYGVILIVIMFVAPGGLVSLPDVIRSRIAAVRST